MGYIRSPKKRAGRYQAEVRLKGHPTLTKTFNRKVDAEAWVQATEADIRRGRGGLLLKKDKQRTFAEAVDRYFKEQTVSVVKRGHLLWWRAELGPLFIQNIRPALLSEKKQKLLTIPTKKGKLRGKSTCNRYLASLSHLMSVAQKQWEWISESPVRKIAREKEPTGRTRFLSAEERARFFDACRASANPFLFSFVVLLLGTGCRYNEIRCLRWTDVDLALARITVSKSKNGDVRSVPIRGLPLELLQKLATSSLRVGYVFPSPNGKKPLDLRRAFRTAIKRAALRSFRGHDTRHSYATEMLAQGLSLGEIGHLLGHRSVAMTKRYTHLTDSRAVEAISKMSEQIFGG